MFAFAFKTLLADRGKLLTAVVGVVFSLVLVSIQGGLYLGLMKKASVLVDNCEADLWVGHKQSESVEFAHQIPVIWLNRIRGLPEVEQAEPFVVAKGVATLSNGGFEDVWIIGSEPNSMMGTAWSFRVGQVQDLLRPNSVSVDSNDLSKLGNPKVGDLIEINGNRARVVAVTDGIGGFVLSPYLFTTIDSARRYGNLPDNRCSYFLIRKKPGTNLHALKMKLKSILPDADVRDAKEFSRDSQDYFLKRTGIGFSFGAATLLGLLVGLTMVAQSLYALALDHLSDYATLKAIGADDQQIRTVVVIQALAIASIGTMFGIGIVIMIQRLWSSPLATIDIPIELLCSGVLLVFVICVLATFLPVYRIQRVDPAVVLQG